MYPRVRMSPIMDVIILFYSFTFQCLHLTSFSSLIALARTLFI